MSKPTNLIPAMSGIEAARFQIAASALLVGGLKEWKPIRMQPNSTLGTPSYIGAAFSWTRFQLSCPAWVGPLSGAGSFSGSWCLTTRMMWFGLARALALTASEAALSQPSPLPAAMSAQENGSLKEISEHLRPAAMSASTVFMAEVIEPSEPVAPLAARK